MATKRPVIPLTANAQATRALLMNWEQTTKLNDEQLEILAQVAELTSEKPIPKHILEKETPIDAEKSGIVTIDDFYAWDLELAQREPSSQLFDLLSISSNPLDSTFEQELKDQSYFLFMSELEKSISLCDSILDRVNESNQHLSQVESEYIEVVKKTSELYQLCEGLLLEERQSKLFLDELRANLCHFEALESVAHKFNNPNLSAEDEHFLPLLKKLDDGIDYFQQHPNIKDSEIYRLKLKQMQNRGLTLVKNYVVSFLRHSASSSNIPQNMRVHTSNTDNEQNQAVQIKNEAKNETNQSLEDLATQVSLQNIKFKTIAPRLKVLCLEVEKRSSQREYAVLLNDISNCYFQIRRNVLHALVQRSISNIIESNNDMFRMLREGCLCLIKICEDEYENCTMLFSAGYNQGLRILLEGFFTTLYDRLRPAIIHTQSIDTLCNLIDILQFEIIESWLEKRPVELAAFRPIVDRIIEDIRDRLIFMADIYLRDEITDFEPKIEDLNYPQKLLNAMEIVQNESRLPNNALDQVRTQMIANDELIDIENFQTQSKHQAWYPTLERTLQLLAKIYVAIDAQTFNGIAQEAVINCSQTLCAASKKIEQLGLAKAKKLPNVPSSSANLGDANNQPSTTDNSDESDFDRILNAKLDSQLFLIKYLVALQENIAPFDIDFFVQERTLDFSHTRDLLRRLMSGELNLASVFALSSNNAIFTILQSATPRLKYSEKDLSKTMEILLSQTMEAFIFTATQYCIDQLVLFLTNSMTFLNSLKKSTNQPEQDGKDQTPLPSLASQKFAEPKLVITMFKSVVERFESHTPRCLSKLNLYLKNHKNAEILFKSVRANILDAFSHFERLVSKEYTDSELKGFESYPISKVQDVLDSSFSQGVVPNLIV